jgi:hypothetical protein
MIKVRLLMQAVAQGTLRWLAGTQPHMALIGWSLVGVALCGASRLLGLDDVTAALSHGGTRQVGFFQAINWSITYTVVFPLTAFFCLRTFQSVPPALSRLQQKGMVWNVVAKQADTSDVLAQSATGLTRSRILLVCLGIALAGAASYGEAFWENIVPVLSGKLDPTYPVDWGVIAHGGPLLWRIGNAAFDFCAFSVQAASLAVILVFFLYFVDLASSLEGFLKVRGLVLVPDIKESDHRLGFEVFEGPLEELLYASITAFLMCYLSRLVKLYLSTTTYARLWDFVQGDLAKGFTTNLASAFSVNALDYGAPTGLFGLLVVVAGFILVAFVALIIIVVLRRLALDGVRSVVQWIEVDPRGLWQGLSTKEVQEKLDAMQIWPLGYPPLNVFLLGIVFAVVALVFYHLVLIVIAYQILVLLLKLGKKT